jgi:hypothetical protein
MVVWGNMRRKSRIDLQTGKTATFWHTLIFIMNYRARPRYSPDSRGQETQDNEIDAVTGTDFTRYAMNLLRKPWVSDNHKLLLRPKASKWLGELKLQQLLARSAWFEPRLRFTKWTRFLEMKPSAQILYSPSWTSFVRSTAYNQHILVEIGVCRLLYRWGLPGTMFPSLKNLAICP